MNENPLVGAWKLVSYQYNTEDGEAVHPYGRDPAGYIMYTADGYMSVQIANRERPRFTSEDVRGGTDAENVAAASSYIAYCGTYELHDDRVIHHVELSFFQNRVGTSQTRYCRLAGDRIELKTPPLLIDGAPRTLNIVWERAAESR